MRTALIRHRDRVRLADDPPPPALDSESVDWKNSVFGWELARIAEQISSAPCSELPSRAYRYVEAVSEADAASD